MGHQKTANAACNSIAAEMMKQYTPQSSRKRLYFMVRHGEHKSYVNHNCHLGSEP